MSVSLTVQLRPCMIPCNMPCHPSLNGDLSELSDAAKHAHHLSERRIRDALKEFLGSGSRLAAALECSVRTHTYT